MRGPERILVTGASGFVGRRLVRALAAERPDTELYGSARSWESPVPECAISITADISNAADIESLAKIRPNIVFHLAGRSSVEASGKDAVNTVLANTMGTLALADAIRRFSPGALFVFASSGEVYGETFNTVDAVQESDALRPMNAYARSKVAAELGLTDLLAKDCGLIVLRLFNHIGPGQDERFVTSSFAAQIARIEKGVLANPIKVGNLSARRDFLDVSDVLRAYIAFVSRAKEFSAGAHVFNVSSGRPTSICQILDYLLTKSASRIDVEIDPDRLRPSEIERAVGSSAKLRHAIDWNPDVPLETSLDEILHYWRNVL